MKSSSFAAIITVLALAFWAQSAGFGQAPAPAAAAPKSDDVRLTVNGNMFRQDASLSLADLRDLPRQTLIVMNEHEKKEETYQGVPLTKS